MRETPERVAEQRKSVRYRLSASALFSWDGSDDQHATSEGITRDICVQGAYVYSANCPPLQSAVEIELLLPPLRGTIPTAAIKARGRVLRVEECTEDSSRQGFAVGVEGFKVGSEPVKNLLARIARGRQETQ